jgi:hypothetical protein
MKCNESFEIIKTKIMESPILIFHDWTQKFHVHVDTSNVAVGAFLAQPTDEMVNQSNAYAIQNFNNVERNYLTMGREGSRMIFSLQKFRHYLLANPFTFYMDHQALNL